ncbi:baseplate J/gp47 family protein [Seminibacterium arietis]|uniref:Baseplate J/gp47 family protein n=1 Tax=Seminibacterium arietis TaxID=1173502 RepID=A0ABW3I802_9PAST
MNDFRKMLEQSDLIIEEQQIKQQFERLTAEQNLITNNSKMSPFWRLITAIAVKPVKWLTDMLIDEVLPNLFVKTAKGKWLQLQAWQVGLDFKPATKAQGVIKFTKESDLNAVTIKKGAVIQTERINEIIYKLIVTEETEIKKGELSAEVPVIAEQAGSDYNLASGYYKILPEPITGVKAVENSENWLTTPGADRETDDELRLRYRVQFASVGQHHIDNVYRGMIAAVAGLSVDRIFFKHDAPRGPGTANAYLLLDTGVTSQPFIDKVNQHIQNGNHGHGDDLICYAIPETKHRLSCHVFFNPQSGVSAVEKRDILQKVENMIRCAFRENNDFNVTKTYPFSRFSFSKLGEEIHDRHNEIGSLIWGQTDITNGLDIPRIEALTVEEQA